MASGTTNFAAHLRSRCEALGVAALADMLDRLESPCEDEVTRKYAEPAPPPEVVTTGDRDPLDAPFEELAA